MSLSPKSIPPFAEISPVNEDVESTPNVDVIDKEQVKSPPPAVVSNF